MRQGLEICLRTFVERFSGVGFCSCDLSATNVSWILVCIQMTDEAEPSRGGRWGGWTAWFTAVVWQRDDHHRQEECNKSLTALLAQRYKCSSHMMHV